MLDERKADLTRALTADLGRPPFEAWLTDLAPIRSQVVHLIDHLSTWAAPEKVRVPARSRPGRAWVVSEPLGAVLVMAPWNYPVQLLLLPAAYALAAGNAVCAKPSERAPATSAALATFGPRYLDPEAVSIVEGGPEEASRLLEQRWDHIFFTGSAATARTVMAAAARHLTPVTLELGGKCPAIVSRDADLDVAARRIVWGKFLNAGQTCVAPDYVVVEEQVEHDLVDRMVKAVGDLYGPDPQTSPDYGRVVDTTRLARLVGLLDSLTTSTVVTGGQSAVESCYLAPTILTGSTWQEPIMAGEIFGPILPVIRVGGLDEAIAMVNSHEKPLAVYVFSGDPDIVDLVVASTSSGGVCANGTVVQLAVPDLPFGGVGHSGMGAYHGRAGYDTFSHRKSVLARSTRFDSSLVYPPYGRLKRWVLERAL